MKKKLILAFALMGCFLTACSTKIPLDDANTEVVAEYAAGLLLRYSHDTPAKLVYKETTPEPTPTSTVSAKPSPVTTSKPNNESPTTTPKPTAKPTDNGGSGVKNQLTANKTPVSLNDIFGVKGVSVSLKSAKEFVSYPEDAGAYSLTAKNGHKLFLVTLSAKNNSTETVKFNLEKKNITYYLHLDGIWYASLITILENDAKFLNQTLASGKSTDFVVAFEVDEKYSTKVSELVLLQDKNSCQVSLN